MADVNDILFLDSSESFSGSSNVYQPGKLLQTCDILNQTR